MSYILKNMPSVQIQEKTMDRLRTYLVNKYQGKIWGKVSSEIEDAINAHIDKMEKATARKKETA
jgi:hypothetical protein